RPTAVAPGTLHQDGGAAVEDPRRGRRATGKTRIDIGAPWPGSRECIEARGVDGAQHEDPSARLAPVSAEQIHGASGADAEIAARNRLVMTGFADLVVAYGNDFDRRGRPRTGNINVRRRGFAAGSGQRRGEAAGED